MNKYKISVTWGPSQSASRSGEVEALNYADAIATFVGRYSDAKPINESSVLVRVRLIEQKQIG